MTNCLNLGSAESKSALLVIVTELIWNLNSISLVTITKYRILFLSFCYVCDFILRKLITYY